MANTCESAIKVVILNKRKWLLRLSQNGNGRVPHHVHFQCLFALQPGISSSASLQDHPTNWLLVSALILYRAVEQTRGAKQCRARHAEDATICFGMRR